MQEPITDFDKEYLKEKRKKTTLIAAAVFMFLAFCGFILYMSLPENMPGTENMQGIITSATSVDTENGKTPAVKIRLNNGEEITLLATDGLTFKPDATISLKKVTSTAGIDSYQFINYLP